MTVKTEQTTILMKLVLWKDQWNRDKTPVKHKKERGHKLIILEVKSKISHRIYLQPFFQNRDYATRAVPYHLLFSV